MSVQSLFDSALRNCLLQLADDASVVDNENLPRSFCLDLLAEDNLTFTSSSEPPVEPAIDTSSLSSSSSSSSSSSTSSTTTFHDATSASSTTGQRRFLPKKQRPLPPAVNKDPLLLCPLDSSDAASSSSLRFQTSRHEFLCRPFCLRLSAVFHEWMTTRRFPISFMNLNLLESVDRVDEQLRSIELSVAERLATAAMAASQASERLEAELRSLLLNEIQMRGLWTMLRFRITVGTRVGQLPPGLKSLWLACNVRHTLTSHRSFR
jgi:hypothetical protein